MIPGKTRVAANPSLIRFLGGRPALRRFIAIRAADELGAQMLNLAVGWHLYSTTGNPMSLALIGFVQFLPTIGLVLFAGHAADHFERSKIIRLSFLAQSLCLAAFALLSGTGGLSTGLVYLLLLITSSARAFSSPAISALLPHTVNAQEFQKAAATTASAFQICSVAGPAIGGLLYALNASAMYAITAALYLFALLQARRLPSQSPESGDSANELIDKAVFAGIRYVRSHRLLLALISLDLFAVLFGGVTALLPIFAKEILFVGPIGLGCLRCAPGLGAAFTGVMLAHGAIECGSGKRMLVCVAGFGLSTVFFALSSNFWLSIVALAAAGGFDMVSMVIRQTLLQTSTPDSVRGRVSAVNGLFIGASSELGEFESGVTAALFGTVPAALIGGLGTLAVVILWAKLFPELRQNPEQAKSLA